MSDIKFYFDESVEVDVSLQLKASGLDCVSAHSLRVLGDTDINHLERASADQRVLCTYDQDFLRLSIQTTEHAGIIFAAKKKATIGDWVRKLRSIAALKMPEDLRGQVIFLPTRK